MIVKMICEQCGEEFNHEIMSHKTTSKKKYCDYCLSKRTAEQGRINRLNKKLEKIKKDVSLITY